LKAAYTALHNGWEKLKALKIEDTFAEHHLNEGFSGDGKKCEILQMVILKPKLAPLDGPILV